MPKLTIEQWKVFRYRWEHGESGGSLAREFDVSETSFSRHKKDQGWTKCEGECPHNQPVIPEVDPAAWVVGPEVKISASWPPDEQETSTDPEPGAEEPPSFSDPEADELRAENTRLQAQLAKTEKERDEYNPSHDVSGWFGETPAELIEFFGEQSLADVAMLELRNVNKVRHKDGLPPITYNDEELERRVIEEAEKILTERHGQVPTEGPLTRVLKMWNPNPAPRGTIVQIPVEGQINNQRGSLSDGITRYKDKRYKIPKPFLCSSQNCNLNAVIGDSGKFRWKGYCSEDHMTRTERAQDRGSVIQSYARP